MTRTALAVVLAALAGCAGTSADTERAHGPGTAAEVASATRWGPAEAGLRMRVDAPAEASRGDALSVHVRLEPFGAAGEVPTLSWHDPALFVRMRLRRIAGGDQIVLRAEDPTGGLPDPPPPDDEPRETRIVPGERLAGCVVSLARAWEVVLPGEYDARVELVHDGDYTNGDAELLDFGGTFRGTLVSQPFRLRVERAPERHLDVRVPAALLGGDVDGRLRLPVRNGFHVGLAYVGELADGSTGGVSQGAPRAGMFDDLLARIAASRGHPTFTIFETSEAPRHLWTPGPGSGHHRVLFGRD